MEKPAPLPGEDAEASLDKASTTQPPVRYVLFPRKGGWSSFPYPDIAALLSIEGEVYYVSSLTQTEDVPPVITVISLPEAGLTIAGTSHRSRGRPSLLANSYGFAGA